VNVAATVAPSFTLTDAQCLRVTALLLLVTETEKNS